AVSRPGCDWKWELFGQDGNGDFECDLGTDPCDSEAFIVIIGWDFAQNVWMYAPQPRGVEGSFLFPHDVSGASPDLAFGIFRNPDGTIDEVKTRPRSPSPDDTDYYESYLGDKFVVPYNSDYFCAQSGDCSWPQSFVTPYEFSDEV